MFDQAPAEHLPDAAASRSSRQCLTHSGRIGTGCLGKIRHFGRTLNAANHDRLPARLGHLPSAIFADMN